MDVAALRLAIGRFRDDVERAQSSPLSSRNSPPLPREIDALDDRLLRIQQWLHAADPRALTRLRASLGQVGHTVNVALERAQQGIDSGAVKASCTGLRSRPSRSPSHLDRRSTDIRECVLLADFTLSVLSLYMELPPPSALLARVCFSADFDTAPPAPRHSGRLSICASRRGYYMRRKGVPTTRG